jgi:hypothetical protein
MCVECKLKVMNMKHGNPPLWQCLQCTRRPRVCSSFSIPYGMNSLLSLVMEIVNPREDTGVLETRVVTMGVLTETSHIGARLATCEYNRTVINVIMCQWPRHGIATSEAKRKASTEMIAVYNCKYKTKEIS